MSRNDDLILQTSKAIRIINPEKFNNYFRCIIDESDSDKSPKRYESTSFTAAKILALFCVTETAETLLRPQEANVGVDEVAHD